MLTSKQRSYLSRLAATLNPTVMIGKEGLSPAVEKAFREEFKRRELVKLRFVANKEESKELALKLAADTGIDLVRQIGFVAVYYRESEDPEKREIRLPQ